MRDELEEEIIKNCSLALNLEEFDLESFLRSCIDSANVKLGVKAKGIEREEVKKKLLNRLDDKEIEEVIKLISELVVKLREGSKEENERERKDYIY